MSKLSRGGQARSGAATLRIMFGPGGTIRIIGHRGGAGAAPENTVPAIRHGVEAGAHSIEIDVRRTACGALVLVHDPTVDRTTDGRGLVANLRLEELRELDAGHRFTPDGGRSYPYRGRSVRIPTLDEGLEAAGALPVILEIKSDAAGVALVEWLERRGQSLPILVGGFSRSAVLPAARRARWRCAKSDELRRTVLWGKFGLRRGLPGDVTAAMVPVSWRGVRVLTRRFVRDVHRQGIGVYAWTVNRPDEMRRLFELGVDGLISDYPAVLRRIVEEEPA